MWRIQERKIPLPNVLVFIEQFTHENGYAPTFREIGSNFQISPSTVSEYMHELRRQGRVTWIRNTARTVKVVK